MPDRPRSERTTQNRVVALFTSRTRSDSLGYRYLGEWSDRYNHPIEVDLLERHLRSRGYTRAQVNAAVTKLQTAAEVRDSTPYQANLRVYQLLRYGVSVQTSPGSPHETVRFIEWDDPGLNDFALAEEVTLRGGHERRPDIVLYLNGIAIVVIELKRSSVDIAEGVRQLISNQEAIFNQFFFAPNQLTIAGSDAQGVRYGTAGTKEQYYVEWKEQFDGATEPVRGELLDRPLAQMCRKERLLDLCKNFMVFDAGTKKVPRPHQYFGAKAAQERLRKFEGGVIWHTQGSGKSILMVLIARWLLETDPDARVLIITDRDELDKQIEGVMRNAGVIGPEAPSPRITSRAEFLEKLAAPTRRVLCALIHKFEPDLTSVLPPTHGRFYVFVDECHRTQGGDMNKQMKRWLPSAIFVGFTGTPLLRKDKQLTRDVFGTYIHTYKFHEAVADQVVLDLKYEARQVPQRLTSQAAIDRWFELKTRNLNNFQKAVLRRRWATMEELMSAAERKQRIIANIIEDFSLKPRLNNDRGTAILVAASIYDACHYFRLFQATAFGQHCAVITSYEPNHNDISREPSHSDARFKFDTYTQLVLAPGQSTADYEEKAKERFIKEPANCKLLIVVSKLLTGFDAPSCTYIYLDNELHDHNLFQAICRTNRLDGEDKDYGYIVDFKELFSDVQKAIAVYSSDELDTDEGGGGPNGVDIKQWLAEGKSRLDEARQSMSYLCEPVPPPKEVEQFIRYFCGNAADPNALHATEALRVTFYKAVATLVRAFAGIAQHLEDAGYTTAQVEQVKAEVTFCSEMRAAIKRHSGEELDIKPYEADMRHLINTYIQADAATELGSMGEMSLTELIIKTGIHDAIARTLNAKGKLSRNSVAEAIINNVRRTVIRDQLADPRFYQQMSALLDDLLQQKREETADYEEFLRKAEELVRRLMARTPDAGVPSSLHGNREATVLYNNLTSIPSTTFRYPEPDEARAAFALQLDLVVRDSAPSGWRNDQAREAVVQNALFPLLQRDREATAALFDIIKNQPGY